MGPRILGPLEALHGVQHRVLHGVWLAAALGIVLAICAPPIHADGALYFADIFYPQWTSGYIRSVQTDGTGLQTVVSVGGGLRAVATDATAGKLYWTDVDNDLIQRANLDGSGTETLISEGLAWPMSIALHPAADRLAWGDQTLGQIGTAQLSGAGAAPVLATPFHCGLAFDALNDKIYWTASNSGEAGEILRANLDGSNVEVVVTGVDKPARIALDVLGNKVYWTDYTVDVVRRANLDGTGVENLYVVGANENPDGIALDLAAGKVYWGQDVLGNRDVLMRMDLNGAHPEVILGGEFGIIADMALVASTSSVAESAMRTPVLRLAGPNPSAGPVAVGFHLAEPRSVEVAVHAVDGRRVATLLQGPVAPGGHELHWDGRDDHGRRAEQGVYLCRFHDEQGSATLKIVLSR